METVNLQPVVKAASPKTPSVAVSPEDVAVIKSEQRLEDTGKELPLARQAEEPATTKEKVEEAVSEMNDFVQNIQRGIQFSVHEESGRSIITVTDKETGAEIRKFPSDEMLSIAEHIAETLAVPEGRAVGLLVNGKA